jgi:hypothetical protein
MTVTPEREHARWGMAVTYSRYKFVTVLLPKRFRNGRFTSGTAVRRFQKLNRHLDPEVVLKIRWNFQKALDVEQERMLRSVNTKLRSILF